MNMVSKKDAYRKQNHNPPTLTTSNTDTLHLQVADNDWGEKLLFGSCDTFVCDFLLILREGVTRYIRGGGVVYPIPPK
jgi:hypothetical protein